MHHPGRFITFLSSAARPSSCMKRERNNFACVLFCLSVQAGEEKKKRRLLAVLSFSLCAKLWKLYASVGKLADFRVKASRFFCKLCRVDIFEFKFLRKRKCWFTNYKCFIVSHTSATGPLTLTFSCMENWNPSIHIESSHVILPTVPYHVSVANFVFYLSQNKVCILGHGQKQLPSQTL